MTISEIIEKLEEFWKNQEISKITGWDMEVGAATFHPLNFFNSISNKPFRLMYIQPSRRFSDGKYGKSPNRLIRHHQFQVIISPLQKNIRNIYLDSLYNLGFSQEKDDIRLIESDWENTALGAFGIGWEVWVNGMEVTQFTFFNKLGDIELKNVVIELSYGVERLALMLNNTKPSIYLIEWDKNLLYKDLFLQFEQQGSKYYLEGKSRDLSFYKNNLDFLKEEINTTLDQCLFYVAYELILDYNKIFNLLIARRLLEPIERKELLKDIRLMVNNCATEFLLDLENS